VLRRSGTSLGFGTIGSANLDTDSAARLAQGHVVVANDAAKSALGNVAEGYMVYQSDNNRLYVNSNGTTANWIEISDFDYAPSNTVCTSSTRPTSNLFAGQKIFETDTNKEFTYSGTGWVQTNTLDGFLSYTPTLTQSVAVSKTITYARYFQFNKLVFVNFQLVVTSAGTASNQIKVSLPVTAASYDNIFTGVGTGSLYDASSAQVFPAMLVMFGLSDVSLTTTLSVRNNGTQYLGISDFTAALNNGDYIAGSLCYQAA
jgi:hypothetical protein